MKTTVITYPYFASDSGVIVVDNREIPYSSINEFRCTLVRLELAAMEASMELVHTHRTFKDGVGVSVNFYCAG